MSQLPQEEMLEMQEARPAVGKARKKFALPPWTKIVLLVSLVCLLAFGATQCLRKDRGHNANVAGLSKPSEQEASRVGVGNQEYNRKLDAYSDVRTREARESGATYIPPHTGSRPVPVEKEEVKVETPDSPTRPKTVEEPRPKRPQEQVVREQQQQNQQERQRMTSWMQRMLVPVKAEGLSTVVLNSPPARMIDASELTGGKSTGGSSGSESGSMESTPPGLMPGDILYAINRITLDSDAPGPSMVEIVDGPYRGARVLGSFKRQGKHLTLEFSSLILPTGMSWQIRGYAIDPRTDRTAVRSGVDNHYLERFGGLIAASFLEGFGEAVSQSGSSSYSNLYGGGYAIPNYKPEEEVWIAAGRVGDRMAGIMERNFDRAPTVTLQSGTDMGVLIISVGEGHNESIGKGISSAQQKAAEDDARMTSPIQHYPNRQPGPIGRRW